MADLFQSGLSGIYSSQANLVTTGHNIANVSTEGYSRQTVDIDSAGANKYGNYFIGNGSMIAGIDRAYDQFAFTENILNSSQAGYATEVYTQTSQIDTVLSSSGTSVAQPVLNMFESINEVADNPNTLEARQVFLEAANSMIAQYNQLYGSLETQYANINSDIVNSADVITTLAENIASLNEQISAVIGAGGDNDANDLMDQRDQAITELSQYVDVAVVDTENNMLNIYIGTGQSLVLGMNSLEMLSINGDPDPSRKELILSINGNQTVIDGSKLGGSVAGLFDARNDNLESAINQLGLNVIGLTHSINEQQKEGQTLDGVVGDDIFNDVNSTTSMRDRVLTHDDGLGAAQLSVRIDDLSTLTADEYELVVDDYQVGPPESISFTATNQTTGESQALTIADLSISSRVELPNSGISIGIDSIDASDPPVAGKTFSLRPTRLAAQTASVEEIDSRNIAAADAEIKAVATETNTGDAVLRTSALNDPLDPLYMDADNPLQINITAVDATTGEVTYDIVDVDGTIVTLPVDSANAYLPAKAVGDLLSGLTLTPDAFTGKMTFNLAGVEVEMISGSPAAGDSFMINYNETGDGDNRNMLKIADLQNEKIMNEGKSTSADVYSSLLSDIGGKAANADITMQTMDVLLAQSFERIQNISGVNMDEEAANLLQFQQYYSASARVVTVATEIFDTILQIR